MRLVSMLRNGTLGAASVAIQDNDLLCQAQRIWRLLSSDMGGSDPSDWCEQLTNSRLAVWGRVFDVSSGKAAPLDMCGTCCGGM